MVNKFLGFFTHAKEKKKVFRFFIFFYFFEDIMFLGFFLTSLVQINAGLAIYISVNIF